MYCMTLIGLPTASAPTASSPLKVLKVTTSTSRMIYCIIRRPGARKSPILWLAKMISPVTSMASSKGLVLETWLALLWSIAVLAGLTASIILTLRAVLWSKPILTKRRRICVHVLTEKVSIEKPGAKILLTLVGHESSVAALPIHSFHG